MTSNRRLPRRRGGFRPPHCPNPDCPHHRSPEGWHYVRNGFFTRPSDRRRFRTFLCRHCGRRFSTRTFSPSYWLRRRTLLASVAAWISEGPALRQMARVLLTTHATVARAASRLGRHCLLFHRQLLESAPDRRPLREPLVIDGFESFEFSQYFPFHVNLAAGANSWFLYLFTDAPLRRKGTMTPAQKLRRLELEARFGRPDPKAIERSIRALVREAIELQPQGQPLVLHSDDHPAYARGLRTLRADPACPTIVHRVTSSRERRTTSNPLFPVNLTDLRIRHGQANHRRETIAYSKRRQRALERMAVFAVWMNCLKRRREKRDQQTSAMAVGLLDRPLTWRDVLRQRLFPARHRLCDAWRAYYRAEVRTAALGDLQAIHTARYAA